MANSDPVGRRPRISWTLRYSSSFMPSAAQGCSTSGVPLARSTVSSAARCAGVRPEPSSSEASRSLPYSLIESLLVVTLKELPAGGGEEAQAVGTRAEPVLDSVLRVRHQADDGAGGVADAGDVAVRAVRVDVEVAGQHLALALEPVQRGLVGDVPARRSSTG